MKLIPTAITIFLFTLSLSGQEIPSTKFQYKNNVQLELGGAGGYYSLNYERIIVNKGYRKLSAQVGFSYYPPSTDYESFWLPIGISGSASKRNGNNHLEVGLGFVFQFTPVDVYLISGGAPIEHSKEWAWDKEGYYTFRFGYRFQKPNGRFVFRAHLMPLVYLDFSDIFLWGAISGGYAF